MWRSPLPRRSGRGRGWRECRPATVPAWVRDLWHPAVESLVHLCAPAAPGALQHRQRPPSRRSGCSAIDGGGPQRRDHHGQPLADLVRRQPHLSCTPAGEASRQHLTDAAPDPLHVAAGRADLLFPAPLFAPPSRTVMGGVLGGLLRQLGHVLDVTFPRPLDQLCTPRLALAAHLTGLHELDVDTAARLPLHSIAGRSTGRGALGRRAAGGAERWRDVGVPGRRRRKRMAFIHDVVPRCCSPLTTKHRQSLAALCLASRTCLPLMWGVRTRANAAARVPRLPSRCSTGWAGPPLAWPSGARRVRWQRASTAWRGSCPIQCARRAT